MNSLSCTVAPAQYLPLVPSFFIYISNFKKSSLHQNDIGFYFLQPWWQKRLLPLKVFFYAFMFRFYWIWYYFFMYFWLVVVFSPSILILYPASLFQISNIIISILSHKRWYIHFWSYLYRNVDRIMCLSMISIVFFYSILDIFTQYRKNDFFLYCGIKPWDTCTLILYAPNFPLICRADSCQRLCILWC